MEIIIGKTAGFCYGVKRAVEGSLKETSDKQIYCLGELVHNKQVMNEIEKQGIKLIEDINEVPNNSKVIIRAHGVVKEIYEIAKEKNIELVDYTCPNVLKIHEVASKYKKENYLKTLKSIQKMLKFFTILTIIGLVGTFLLMLLNQ